ncbi:hypothetical protein K523DRAFT_358933 [Schizophyllum commune Tattone D]|nr:hypothetical protein K523DRAFT_358933 [Schizophyllum commune Tattone D]
MLSLLPPPARRLQHPRSRPDVLLARSRRLGQPPRCVLDVIVVPAGPWWAGGDEPRARSGAERRCARIFAGASYREMLANRRQLR